VTQSYTTTVNADFGAGTLPVTGNYVVASGTGRFTGAAGGGGVDVTGSLAPPCGVSGTSGAGSPASGRAVKRANGLGG